ncbi:DJ-1/PfpI family protein [Algoriphagus aestuariicola]|uniref:DJ-1/PfpI family protein n=1 Tax=Algoriphagus aestuariicola TaxID=1852016 RepID=A0ABS3BVB2_9BACT|nr:DJ-1/PfpI family protein [Algoriphagus aestuariicola]MBN7803229.1 DJ-1/PfpI family protein [Algoriphagus aestuariicola]
MKRLFLWVIMGTMIQTSLLGQSTGESRSYVCPPCGSSCDSRDFSGPGTCPQCNMTLVEKNRVKKIAFYLQDGVEVLDFAGPMEVFSYAGYKVFTVSKTKDPIKSQGILKVIPDYSIDDAPKADILAFFGGNASRAYQDSSVIEWIQGQTEVEYHFSVCTGAFMLAEAGILDGKKATTFHNSLNSLEENYPEIEVLREVRFVDNGKVVTTAGISAGIDGALHLVAKFQGLNAARRTAFYMEYDNWVPGDGLVLSGDSPYQFATAGINLEDFVGKYSHFDSGAFDLTLNKENQTLYAEIQGVNYPIFHEYEDVFSDVEGGELIYFQRGEDGKINGYKVQADGEVFAKLN